MIEPNTLTGWRKASYSGGADNCVEVAFTNDGSVCVRDSKRLAGPVLSVGLRQWEDFLALLRRRGLNS